MSSIEYLLSHLNISILRWSWVSIESKLKRNFYFSADWKSWTTNKCYNDFIDQSEPKERKWRVHHNSLFDCLSRVTEENHYMITKQKRNELKMKSNVTKNIHYHDHNERKKNNETRKRNCCQIINYGSMKKKEKKSLK